MSGSQASQNPFRFSTKFTDDESGLVNYGYRYYNPSTGRWISRDPIGERGSANVFGFCGNMPSAKVDSLGLAEIPPGGLFTVNDFAKGGKSDCCGSFAVIEIKGVEVPESQQGDADGHSTLDGFKAMYFPCDSCSCKADRIKLVQARRTPGYSAAFDRGKGVVPYIGKDKVIVLPEYGGWSGPEPFSFLDGPYNRLNPTGVFESEVCAVCRDGQKVLGCVTFNCDMGTRKLQVPGAKALAPEDLARWGKPGPHGEGPGSAGYIIGCSDPGKLWDKASKAWTEKLQPN